MMNNIILQKEKSLLFYASFLALAAAGVGFVFRVLSITLWAGEFSITGEEAGAIFGASLWPIAVTMILFSLLVDKIGYKISMIIAFTLQTLSIIMTYYTGYGNDAVSFFWWASFLGGLGHGTIEAVINPLCASMYRNEKSKMLNILHAAWPAGIVFGGIVFITIGDAEAWRSIFLVMLLPIIPYLIMFMKAKKFPLDERVEAGVSYKDMLKEFGGLGIFLSSTFVFYELMNQLNQKFDGNLLLVSIIFGAILGAYIGFLLKSKGKWLFFFLCLIMIPLATVELGTDAWIRSLMEPVMGAEGASWAIVISALIMMTLRFFAGIPLKYTSPLGLLLISSCFSILGLLFLAGASGVGVLVAFVLYAVGQTFYWPTVLGFVAEQFPKGGAMTLNTVSAMGLLTIGIFGAPFLGSVKDSFDASTVKKHAPALYEKYKKKDANFFSVSYDSVKTADLLKDESISLPHHKKGTLNAFGEDLKEKIDTSARSTLRVAAILPAIMAISFILMMLHFKRMGGYKPVELISSTKKESDNTKKSKA